ncbi:MAG TPA: OB-fold domain-containing protein [Candidatus Dormibacteraeota bacterium]|nr:OB-fold domain-containing protein [Candidatus Dormibacteraeota bacterium]
MSVSGVGLRALAVALPRWRLTRAEWARAWGRRPGPGSRPVAGHDEDSVTLAADALDRLTGAGGVDALYVAGVTAPDAERSSSSVLCAALDLGAGVLTADLGGSLRSGAAAALLAADRVRARGAEVLVAAADRRDAEPGTDLEPVLGDAGAAARLGPAAAGDLAVLAGSASSAADLPDAWRPAGEDAVRRADAAFSPRLTLGPGVRAALERACADAGVTPAEIAAVAAGGAEQRLLTAAVEAGGVAAAAAGGDPRALAAAGDCGSASSWVALAAALDAAAPGDLIAQVAAAGGGADVLIWRAGDGLDAWTETGGSGLDVPSGQEIPSYARFLRLRGRIGAEPLSPYTSAALLWREGGDELRLAGSECAACGWFAYPRRPLCVECGGRELRERRLGRRGTVVTWTEDHVFPSPEPPTIMAVAEMEGGGRFFGQMAATPPGLARTGLPVRLVLRRLHEGGSLGHYFWKLLPVEES